MSVTLEHLFENAEGLYRRGMRKKHSDDKSKVIDALFDFGGAYSLCVIVEAAANDDLGEEAARLKARLEEHEGSIWQRLELK